jgi:DNA polymerase III sliding clamp (beta) subunit (PCNA family)
MEIQVSRFRETLELLKPAVARKSTIKSIEHILLKDGKAAATDLETFVITAVPEADLTTLVPFNDVVKVLKFTPGRELLTIKSKSGKLLLSWADGSATFPTEDPGDFPDIPEFVPETEGSINSDILVPALVRVLPYAATDSDRAVLAGVTLILGDPVEVAAGDGYRMADQVLPLSFPTDKIVIIPSSSVRVLKHLWEKTPRTPSQTEALVPALLAKKHVMVAHDGKVGLRFQYDKDTTAIIKLVDGQPPDWLKLLPKGEPVLSVHLMARELEVAVRRVMAVALDEKGIVRLAFKDDKVTVSAKSDGHKVDSSFQTMEKAETPQKFGLNVNYLLGYLGGKEGLISLTWTGGTSPVALQSKDDPRVLIMPMAIEK